MKMFCSEECECLERTSVLELFRKKDMVSMCAPMVRYSKLPFRLLVRKYSCDVAFTPMIISQSFIESEKARSSDFSTCASDRPLVVQFAAKQGSELADAAEIVYANSDGIDVNCGCPQRWAMSDGYGACLLDKPDVIHDMITQVKNRIPDSDYTVSLKIRIHKDIRHTVELCRRAEKAGASWISVHGRTKDQRTEPVNLSSIKLIKENLNIPVVGNGDVVSLKGATEFQNATKVDGIMCARGLLQNPALFHGNEVTPFACLEDWMNFSLSYGSTFTSIHHHLMFMLERVMSRPDRKLFNSYTSLAAVVDHLNSYS